MIIDAPSRAQIPALRALWREAFGDGEEFLDIFWRTAFSFDRCRCVTLEGDVAGALYWFDCECRVERVAYISAVATARSHRGQGICRRLIEDVHGHLEKLGYVGAVLVPGSAELFEFYRKLGYEVCSSIDEVACTSSEEAVELRRVGVDEYARLRRKLLPLGGVVQEGENLSFLNEQTELYAGEGFLLAARRTGEKLNGIELLGDADRASAIVSALGCAEGSFRVPGGDKPFAMYFSLDGKSYAPEYFGLAFD